MLSGNELYGVDTFIVTRLRADAGLTALVGTRVFADAAPANTVFPYTIALFQSGLDRNAIPVDARILVQVSYFVKAVTQADDYVTANAIADRIDLVLIGASGAVPAHGINVGVIYRTEVIRYIEIEDGRRVNHLGATYRCMITAG